MKSFFPAHTSLVIGPKPLVLKGLNVANFASERAKKSIEFASFLVEGGLDDPNVSISLAALNADHLSHDTDAKKWLVHILEIHPELCIMDPTALAHLARLKQTRASGGGAASHGHMDTSLLLGDQTPVHADGSDETRKEQDQANPLDLTAFTTDLLARKLFGKAGFDPQTGFPVAKLDLHWDEARFSVPGRGGEWPESESQGQSRVKYSDRQSHAMNLVFVSESDFERFGDCVQKTPDSILKDIAQNNDANYAVEQLKTHFKDHENAFTDDALHAAAHFIMLSAKADSILSFIDFNAASLTQNLHMQITQITRICQLTSYYLSRIFELRRDWVSSVVDLVDSLGALPTPRTKDQAASWAFGRRHYPLIRRYMHLGYRKHRLFMEKSSIRGLMHIHFDRLYSSFWNEHSKIEAAGFNHRVVLSCLEGSHDVSEELLSMRRGDLTLTSTLFDENKQNMLLADLEDIDDVAAALAKSIKDYFVGINAQTPLLIAGLGRQKNIRDEIFDLKSFPIKEKIGKRVG